jgi:hypothetical protein
MGVTKVGPPDKSDLPRKKGAWHRIFRFLYVASGLAWIANMLCFLPSGRVKQAVDVVTSDRNASFHYMPPPGIPDADLTDDERESAVQRIKQEQAIRRARGE